MSRHQRYFRKTGADVGVPAEVAMSHAVSAANSVTASNSVAFTDEKSFRAQAAHMQLKIREETMPNGSILITAKDKQGNLVGRFDTGSGKGKINSDMWERQSQGLSSATVSASSLDMETVKKIISSNDRAAELADYFSHTVGFTERQWDSIVDGRYKALFDMRDAKSKTKLAIAMAKMRGITLPDEIIKPPKAPKVKASLLTDEAARRSK